MNKIGTIDISRLNSPPEKAEFETAKYFAELGKDIVFIDPSDIPNQHTPDIKMDGAEWEIKCPTGDSKRTIENNRTISYLILDILSCPKAKVLLNLSTNLRSILD